MLYSDYKALKAQLQQIPQRANSENQNAINAGNVSGIIFSSNLNKDQKQKLMAAMGDVNPSGYYYERSGSASVIAFLDDIVAKYFESKGVAA